MRIALIAHDGKKPEMVQFITQHKNTLQQVELIATGTTGGHIQNAGFNVVKLLSGPKGGDAQIAAMVAEGKLHGFSFLEIRSTNTHTSQIFKCSCVYVTCITYPLQQIPKRQVLS